MADILFVHPNFPGQFKWLARALAGEKGYRIWALRDRSFPAPEKIAGIRVCAYEPPQPLRESVHRYLQGMEMAVRRGQQVVRACAQLRKSGLRPDLIVAHPGWGDALYLKDIFPDTPVLAFFEYYYHARGADVGFDPEFPAQPDAALRLRTMNALHLMMLEACDGGICPTAWQKSLFPEPFQKKLRVIHEGINTQQVRPDAKACFTLPDGSVLRAGDEVLTFVSRALEPYRGYHSLLRALPRILAERPHCRVLIVGEEGQYYAPPPADGVSYKQRYLREVENAMDMSRVFFLGSLPFADYLKVLQVSKAHAYLSYPFILSWSMLEAMSAGCTVIGSKVPPVQEVIVHGENGLLVDFFNYGEIAETIIACLGKGLPGARIGANARRTITERFDFQSHGLENYKKILASYLAVR